MGNRRPEFSELPLNRMLGRRYTHYPMRAFSECRELTIFRHVSDIDLSEVVAAESNTGTYSYSRYYEFPRVDPKGVVHELRCNFGVWCNGHAAPVGKTVSEEEDLAKYYEMRLDSSFDAYKLIHNEQWTELGLCDECMARAKVNAWQRCEKMAAKERVEKKREREWRAARDARRAALDEQWRIKREAKQELKERERLEREAAYQLVKKLGLLEQLEGSHA